MKRGRLFVLGAKRRGVDLVLSVYEWPEKPGVALFRLYAPRYKSKGK